MATIIDLKRTLYCRLSVRVVSSTRSGSGKSLFVRRLSEKLINNDIVIQHLRNQGTNMSLCTTVPIHVPAVNQSAVVEALLPHDINPATPLSRMFHLDIAPLVCINFIPWDKNPLKSYSFVVICVIKLVFKEPIISLCSGNFIKQPSSGSNSVAAERN